MLEWTDATEADVPADALETASEAFLTSSTRDVQPIVAVDGRRLDAGPVTAQAAAEFARRSAIDVDP